MEFEISSPSPLQLYSTMSAKSNPSTEISVSTSSHQKRHAPILTDSEPEILSDAYKQMLDRSFDELKTLLTDICTEGNTLLKKFQSEVPKSNLKRLEGLIPRLDEVSKKLVKTVTPQINGNGKRPIEDLKVDDDDDEDIIELKPVTNGYKKVKHDLVEPGSPEVIMMGSAFSIKFICHGEIQSFMTPEKLHKYGYWSSDGKESSLTIKREDFLNFPNHVTLRLSKEHAKITALKNGNNITYEITDLSVNGIHYLGNRIEGNMKERPVKLQKGIPFRLKHGDWICLLLKKESRTPEVLLGFEFIQDK